jgi:hypothetical protein
MSAERRSAAGEPHVPVPVRQPEPLTWTNPSAAGYVVSIDL